MTQCNDYMTGFPELPYNELTQTARLQRDIFQCKIKILSLERKITRGESSDMEALYYLRMRLNDLEQEIERLNKNSAI